MAIRPAFVPWKEPPFYMEVPVEFNWVPGTTFEQQALCGDALQAACVASGLGPTLEVSTRSRTVLGYSLSAFNLSLGVIGIPLECAYQASKKFEHGGPYKDLLHVRPVEAKRDPRLKNSGALTGFVGWNDDRPWPLDPHHLYYDWLYLSALRDRSRLWDELCNYMAFTDVCFNPQKSVNCQARSCAKFVGMFGAQYVTHLLATPERWIAHNEVRPAPNILDLWG